MISVTDLRSGAVFEDNGSIYQVISYEHIKVGRGSASIRVKVKNIRSQAITDKSFINGSKVNSVHITKKTLQYLYKDIDSAFFMDPKTFEQISINLKHLGGHEYLKDGQDFTISFLEEEPISLDLPPKLDLEVSDTGPGVKGNSATNIFKDAILENGIKTKVPLFIKVGDKVRIDTRTGDYTERV